MEQIQDIPPEKIAYVDECGIDNYLYRRYGYAVRGQPVFGRIRGRKYKRRGIVAAKMDNKILAPLQYNGTMDRALFGYFVLPKMPDADFCFFHRIPRNLTPLKSFGPGSSAF